MFKLSNLEFTFEVGGSLDAAGAMFLEPCNVCPHYTSSFHETGSHVTIN